VLAIAAILLVLALLTLLVGAVWIAIPAIVGLAVLVASRTGVGRRGRRTAEPRA
jgi:hypothetical protein